MIPGLRTLDENPHRARTPSQNPKLFCSSSTRSQQQQQQQLLFFFKNTLIPRATAVPLCSVYCTCKLYSGCTLDRHMLLSKYSAASCTIKRADHHDHSGYCKRLIIFIQMMRISSSDRLDHHHLDDLLIQKLDMIAGTNT